MPHTPVRERTDRQAAAVTAPAAMPARRLTGGAAGYLPVDDQRLDTGRTTDPRVVVTRRYTSTTFCLPRPTSAAHA
ncbi:MAG: hypothetical protein AVDCRST_MAG57-3843 [uncultured Blastococcus sp.]|uniref:Uncharacterized protein n=1 Tax=uncultured Blastococcus sp. TaxID=217144 RepID=A0A6J4JL07_9ACTN|nr:MAG: hypothetical protein AVDCRST_MAG57-3843 [uncultured Blastococcus sp.]